MGDSDDKIYADFTEKTKFLLTNGHREYIMKKNCNFFYEARKEDVMKKMNEEKYIETITINDYFELQDIIQGRGDYIDFRNRFIFRGINKKSYPLIPSSLRDNSVLEYIDSEYKPSFNLEKESALNYGLNIEK